MDSRGEVLLTIMADLVQQESQSLSQNIKLGLQYRYQNGEVRVNHNRFLEYTKDQEGHLVIEPEGGCFYRLRFLPELPLRVDTLHTFRLNTHLDGNYESISHLIGRRIHGE